MKKLFIPGEINFDINEKKIKSLNLPKNISIAYSIQYKNSALKIKKILSKNHKINFFVQILGCSKLKFPKDTEAILLISSGRFHGIPLAVESNLPVYVFDLEKISKISDEEINNFVKRKKSSYLNFLNSEKVGILISTKPGQENLQRAISLKSKLKNKNSYFFIANEIDKNQFENFSDIQSWINTACPRLDFDNSVVNINDLL